MASLITVEEIDDEVEVPLMWHQGDIKEEAPSADVKEEEIEGTEDLYSPNVILDLVTKEEAVPEFFSVLLEGCPVKSEPNALEELERLEDVDPFQDIKPNILTKAEDELSINDCQTDTEGGINLQELEVIEDIDPFQDVKPNILPKTEDELSINDCKIEPEGDIHLQTFGVIQDLVPKVKTEMPASPVKQEDCEGVHSNGITVHPTGLLIPLNDPSNRTKSKVPADTNNSGSTSNVFTKTTYTCEMCNTCFPCQVRYRKHLLNHPESELLTCAHCGYKTLTKIQLISHINEHLREVKKPFSCKDCSYKCSQYGILKRHMLRHTGEEPYSCNVCSYKCYISRNLKRHMQTHTEEKTYSCNVCSYKCSVSCSLKRHMLRHTGEKPYSCNVCSYKCSQYISLKRHTLTHTGEKPYSCNVCSYKCSQYGNLKIHMQTHTGGKP